MKKTPKVIDLLGGNALPQDAQHASWTSISAWTHQPATNQSINQSTTHPIINHISDRMMYRKQCSNIKTPNITSTLCSQTFRWAFIALSILPYTTEKHPNISFTTWKRNVFKTLNHKKYSLHYYSVLHILLLCAHLF